MADLMGFFNPERKDILKKPPKVRFENFFEGLGLKVYINSNSPYSQGFSGFYIKEKWFKRAYASSTKVRKAFTKLEEIIEDYKRQQKETNLIGNLKVIANSLMSKGEDEAITMEKFVRFIYKNSIILEFLEEDVFKKPEISRSHITLMLFLLKYFKACKTADFFKAATASKHAFTHLLVYKNNNNLFTLKDAFDSHPLITNVLHYDAIPGDILFFKFVNLPDLETPPEDFVLLYIDGYPEMYFPFEGIRGKETLKFMNFLPVFQSRKGYRFPMIASNTPFVCRGEEEVIIDRHKHIKIEPSRKKLKEMFTDSFRRKGMVVLGDKKYPLETDKINFIASPQAEDSGFYPYELKVYNHRLPNVRHIAVEDTNDIIQRNPFIVLEYEYNTARWWMAEKGSFYGRRLTVENSQHKKVNPSMFKKVQVKDLDYTVNYYDLSRDTDYFIEIEYLDRNTIIVLNLGSAKEKE
jgi:hypothetical protein